ncbi:hypothetical protein V2P20_03655 [Methylobacter sp. Wu1]|uniref:hypothetical protein n=1 Tax=Methylobacter sp. Wu1 TaxID=3119359 RepID=UPI002F91FC9D
MPLKYSNSPSINDSMFAKSVIAFAISSIFATGEAAALYEPWDLSTLFKDSIGTIPAVVDQEVGLMLDKRYSTANLIINGSFDVDVSGWTPSTANVTPTLDAGRLKVSNSGAGYVYQAVTVVPNTPYVLFGNFVSKTSSGRILVGPTIGGSTYGSVAATGNAVVPFIPTVETIYISLGDAAGAAGAVNIYDSFKLIQGAHQFQNTTASKPILRQDANGFYYLEHDGLDDQLTTGNVFTIQNDSFMALAYAYNASSGSAGLSILGLQKDALNYMYLAQRPATAHIYSVAIRAANFGLLPSGAAGTVGSTTPNTPIVTHARLINDLIYVGKNNVEQAPGSFLMGANTITAAPLKINTGLAIDLRFYGGLYRQKDLTPTERANVISYFAQHAGVTI